jgi:hypothetical protein
MTKQLILMPGPNNVGAAKTAYLDCPMGYRYHALFLHILGDTAASNGATNLPTVWVNDIRVKLGGKQQRLHTAAELNKLNTLKGANFAAGTLGSSGASYGQVLPVYLAEPWRKDIAQAEFPAWVTGPGRQLQVEIDCGTPTGTSPAPAIVVYALVDKGGDINNNPIVKVYRSDYPTGTAIDIVTLDKRDLYQSINVVKGTSATFTKAVLKADGVAISEAQTGAAQAAIMKQLDNNSGQFDAELILDGFDPLQDGFPAAGVKDFQLRVEQSAAGT